MWSYRETKSETDIERDPLIHFPSAGDSRAASGHGQELGAPFGLSGESYRLKYLGHFCTAFPGVLVDASVESPKELSLGVEYFAHF